MEVLLFYAVILYRKINGLYTAQHVYKRWSHVLNEALARAVASKHNSSLGSKPVHSRYGRDVDLETQSAQAQTNGKRRRSSAAKILSMLRRPTTYLIMYNRPV